MAVAAAGRRVLLGAAAARALQETTAMAETPPRVPPARPGDVAIAQELAAARAARSLAAYDLFIARHPAHPLAEEARAERAALAAAGGR